MKLSHYSPVTKSIMPCTGNCKYGENAIEYDDQGNSFQVIHSREGETEAQFLQRIEEYEEAETIKRDGTLFGTIQRKAPVTNEMQYAAHVENSRQFGKMVEIPRQEVDLIDPRSVGQALPDIDEDVNPYAEERRNIKAEHLRNLDTVEDLKRSHDDIVTQHGHDYNYNDLSLEEQRVVDDYMEARRDLRRTQAIADDIRQREDAERAADPVMGHTLTPLAPEEYTAEDLEKKKDLEAQSLVEEGDKFTFQKYKNGSWGVTDQGERQRLEEQLIDAREELTNGQYEYGMIVAQHGENFDVADLDVEDRAAFDRYAVAQARYRDAQRDIANLEKQVAVARGEESEERKQHRYAGQRAQAQAAYERQKAREAEQKTAESRTAAATTPTVTAPKTSAPSQPQQDARRAEALRTAQQKMAQQRQAAAQRQPRKLTNLEKTRRRAAGYERADFLLKRDSRPEYIQSIDEKHITGSGAGSKFTSPDIKRTEDVIALANIQRGTLAGDDRERLIQQGADPNSFLPPESGVRYLMVKTEGTEAIKNTASLPDDQEITIEAKGRNDGRPPSLSFTVPVTEQPTTNYGTIIVGPELDDEKKPIPRTETLWTTHPGVPTRGIRSDDVRSKGLDAGDKITVGKLRELFGKDIMVNTKLEES